MGQPLRQTFSVTGWKRVERIHFETASLGISHDKGLWMEWLMKRGEHPWWWSSSSYPKRLLFHHSAFYESFDVYRASAIRRECASQGFVSKIPFDSDRTNFDRNVHLKLDIDHFLVAKDDYFKVISWMFVLAEMHIRPSDNSARRMNILTRS